MAKDKIDIKELIRRRIREKKELKVADIVQETGFTRAYISRFFQALKNEGNLFLLGRANRAKYVSSARLSVARKSVLRFHRIVVNRKISEDIILAGIKKETGIFIGLPENVIRIVDYAFTEMLNNAIEHSRSSKIEIWVERTADQLTFRVIDSGVGIFRNLIQKHRLRGELEAIQELLKGKQTTAPGEHTGEGVFFTSKMADVLMIQGGRKVLIFNNLVEDIFIRDNRRPIIGTKVYFAVSLKSKRKAESVFGAFTDNSFSFNKTEARVKLYKIDSEFISRSQARRVLSGLEKFRTIILDFKDVEFVGQAFADEVFRVWVGAHPDKKVVPKNYNENIEFMIKRATLTNSKF